MRLRSILDARSELKQEFVNYDCTKDTNKKFLENLKNLLGKFENHSKKRTKAIILTV